MSSQSGARRAPLTAGTALCSTAAGAAVAVGAFAAVELLSIAVPLTRGTWATWGPVLTVAAVLGVAVLSVPAALVELLTRRSARRAVSTLVGYVAIVALLTVATGVLWIPGLSSGPAMAPAGSVVGLLAVALAMWGGARVADHQAGRVWPLFAASAVLVACVVAVTAIRVS